MWTYTVKFKPSTDEYVTRFYVDGVERKEARYYTTDRKDADDTGRVECSRLNEIDARKIPVSAPESGPSVIPSRSRIARWMGNHVDEYVDDCNEVNATGLAEACAASLDAYEDTIDYNIPAIVFDVAAEVANAWEEGQSECASADARREREERD